MKRNKQQRKALSVLNYDLFECETLAPPAPATLYSTIRARATAVAEPRSARDQSGLPSVEDLYRLFDRFNNIYFDGSLPRVRIEYSSRMLSAGSYTPHDRIIRIGRKYHELFPEDLEDTLKHEMIHIRHYRHDTAFKREARRIGASLKAKPHPALRKPARYLYSCPNCGRLYPRQRRLVMASCGVCTPGKHFDSRFKLRLVRD